MEQRLIEYVANACWQLPLLAAGAWILLRIARMSAAVQHRVWVSVLALGLLLPFYGWQRTGPAPAGALVAPSSPALYLGESFDSAAATRGAVGSAEAADWRALGAWSRRVELNATVAQWVTVLFFAVALFGLIRFGIAWRAARRLVKDSRKVMLPGRMAEMVAESSRRLGVNPPRIRRSSKIAGPVVVGISDPVLLWPESFASVDDDEVMAALCHEMAHIRRRDYAMNLACEAAALPLRWHPAAYWVGSRIRSTREMACDAMAAAAMESEAAYAHCLLSLAHTVVGNTGGWSSAVGLFNGNALEERMMRLIQAKTAMSGRSRMVRGAAGATAMALSLGLAAGMHVVPAMAQITNAPATQSAPQAGVTAGVQQGVSKGVKGGVQQGVRGGVRKGVQDGAVAPQVKVKVIVPDLKIMPQVKVTPVVKVQPLVKLAKVSPEVDVIPMVKVSPVVNMQPMIKVSPMVTLDKVSPMMEVTPEMRLLPKLVLETPGTQADPKQEGSGTGTGSGAGKSSGNGSGNGSGHGSGHRMYAVVNGQERELTPEEQARVEAQLAKAQEQIAAATAKINSPEFRKQIEDAQQKAMEAERKLNSGEMQRQMAEAQKEVAAATARLSSPEFRQQMEKAQRDAAEAAARMNSAEFQKQMADAQKQVADAAAKIDSPEFRQQMEKGQRDAAEAAAKMNSAEFQKQMADAQKQLADAMAQMKAEQEKDSDAKKP